MKKSGKTIKKSDVVILVLTALVLLAALVFCLCEWRLIVSLFDLIVRGKTIVKDYVLSFGVLGEIAIMLVLIFCFFFPFISSLPLQIVCVMTYGVLHATALIAVALALAAQLLFFLEKNVRTFVYSQKQREKQKEIEECIRTSNRNVDIIMILLYIVPCIPFLVISSVACRSNMKWWKYTLYTALGPIPEIIVTLVLGNQLTTNSSPAVSFAVLLFMILLVVLSLVFRDQMIYFIFNSRKKKVAVSADGESTPAIADPAVPETNDASTKGDQP